MTTNEPSEHESTLSPDAPGQKQRQPVLWLLAVVAVLIVVIAILAALLILQQSAGRSASPSSAAQPTVRATAPQPSQPAKSTPATPAASTAPPKLVNIPTDCKKLFTLDWASKLNGLVLGPMTATPDEVDEPMDVLFGNAKLRCQWAAPAGTRIDASITTVVAKVTTQQAADAQAKLKAEGQVCAPQYGGVRCLWQSSNAQGTYGHSHLFRDGIWLATFWWNAGPDGYTADVAKALFG